MRPRRVTPEKQAAGFVEKLVQNGSQGRCARNGVKDNLEVASPSKTAPDAFFSRHLHSADFCETLNHMVQCNSATFNASFAALSDVTRRGVLDQLARADASITELADRFRMSLTGMKKHVGVLEQAGLVTTRKLGRVRTCTLGANRLEQEMAWIARHQQLWSERFDALDSVLNELKQQEMAGGRKKRK